jgi:hypothetical protein
MSIPRIINQLHGCGLNRPSSPDIRPFETHESRRQPIQAESPEASSPSLPSEGLRIHLYRALKEPSVNQGGKSEPKYSCVTDLGFSQPPGVSPSSEPVHYVRSATRNIRPHNCVGQNRFQRTGFRFTWYLRSPENTIVLSNSS